jgi:magnesium transporter
MVRLFKRRHKEVGLPPGTLEFVGQKKVDKTRITVWDYDEEQLDQKEVTSAEESFPYRDTPRASWINVDGLHETELLRQIAEHYDLHPLVMEDVVNVHQRAKLEDYDRYLYIVIRMIAYDGEKHEVSSEQVSIVLGSGYVLTFQERPGDVFEPIRGRIKKSGRIRMANVDYLAYALLDTVVDNYFVILERFGEEIESLEEDLVQKPTPDVLERIHRLKRELIVIRRSVWPLREVASGLERSDSKLIKKSTRIFLRDLYDHTIQVIDAVESYREMISGLQDLYLSSVSNRMNEVMKVLTIIATLFIPLSFAAGVFGMNFEHMPELKWKWSYLVFWLAIAGISGSMLVYFRKKGWL